MNTFGKWLKLHRKAIPDMTQKKLAELSGQSKSYISILENDHPHPNSESKLRPSEPIVEIIARALKVDVNEARLAAGYAPLTIVELDMQGGQVVTAIPKDFPEPFQKERSKLSEELKKLIESGEQEIAKKDPVDQE